MKPFFRLFAILLTFVPMGSSWAVTQINFVGPKITNTIQFNGQTQPIVFPGDFDVFQFMGGDPLLDAAVPSNARLILGSKNLNQWETAGPNTYFDIKTVTAGGVNIQVVSGNFDNNATLDIVDLAFTNNHVELCYDYAGSPCNDRVIIDLYKNPADKEVPLEPIAARVGDLNGDGKDDLALITIDTSSANQGYFIFLAGTGNKAAPFDSYQPIWLQKMTPFSIAVGDFDGKGKPDDVAIGSLSHAGTHNGILSVMLNTGAGGTKPFGDITEHDQKDDSKYPECSVPTGLESYDPNTDGFSDLVMTCFLQYTKAAGVTGGPVLTLKNMATTGKAYSTEQTLKNPGDPGLNYPTRTALGDFNGDGQTDFAVAEFGGQNVLVYEGSAVFQVNDGERRVISSAPYPPTFIQIHDMNNDGSQDIILTARGFPQARRLINPSHGLQTQDSISTHDSIGYYTNLCVQRDDSVGIDRVTPVLVDQAVLVKAKTNDSISIARQSRVLGNDYRVEARPGVVSQTMRVPAAVYVGERPKTNLDYPGISVAKLKVCDGILVYLNFQPEVTFSEVDCYTEEITYTCVAKGGNTIQSCEATSADITIEGTPATAPTWTGTIKIPKDKKSFTVKVTAKDSGGGEHVGELNVNLEDCPGASGQCPAELIKQEVWPQEPFALCVPQDLADKAVAFNNAIEWEQTGGPALFVPTPDKAFVYKNVGVDGPCITGSFQISQDAFSVDQFDFVYKIKLGAGQAPIECPAKLVKLGAGLEGSGKFCALDKSGTVRPAALSLALILMASLGFLFALRGRATVKNNQ